MWLLQIDNSLTFGMNQILLQIKNFLRATIKVSEDYRALDPVLILGGKRFSNNFQLFKYKGISFDFFSIQKKRFKILFFPSLIEFHF